jgi:menaquinone-specific isochorismate synthase
MAAVEQAVAAIKDGRVDKVVLAREVFVDADVPFDRVAVLGRLRDTNPLAFVYADGPFVGASPELLVRRTGGLVESHPMAGTVRQGAPDDDRRVAALATSDKDLGEHRLTVDAVRDALAPVTDRLDVPDRPSVVRLPTVAHLATAVSGQLRRPHASVLALLQLLHPTPAVGGVPRPEALVLQAELEGFDRGRYAGPVGWVDAAGDGEFAVALRGADLSGLDGRRARLVAGNGIVEGSQPEDELAETRAKLEPMLRALVQV